MLMAFATNILIKHQGNNAIIHWIWVMHLALFATIYMNNFNALGVAKSTVNAAVMLLYVFFLISIFVEWIPYPNVVLPKDGDEKDAEPEEGKEVEVEEEEEEGPGDLALAFWLKLEVLVFSANIIANMIFLLLRSCSRSRIELAAKEEEKHESEDALEKQ